MYRLLIVAGFLSLCLWPAAAEPPSPAAKEGGKTAEPANLADKPITTAQGPLGDLLRKWWQEKTAAGNVGDWYDNRDRAHSDLNMGPYPQLQRIVYTPEEIKGYRDWAAMGTTRPHVTFGNSSTSAPILQGGSNPRHYYVSPRGLAILHDHYTHNNIYIYPEHRDHDPGHNGRMDGYGDVYPTNTPYLITSQGSSGSDQPFMQAIPYTLAAFRPEVKKRLADEGLLMPTLQMIFRSTNKHLKDPSEYLTGKAHPTVFEGSWVNDRKMVELAHEIQATNLPPMVKLKVVEEDEPVLGKDFFEPGTEKLADTPAVVSRIFRGSNLNRRMVVSAEGSHDLNKRPLAFEWKILRGDAARIMIKPKNEARSVVELVVPYHERRPVAPGSLLESNRVDIGVFVHNGAYYSAPAFITFFSLDNEARTYDENGRILEIGYGMGEATCTVADWRAFFAAIGSDMPAQRLLSFTKEERAALQKAGEEHKPLAAAFTAAQEKRQTAETEKQKAAAAVKKAEEQRTAAEKEQAAKPSETTKAALDNALADVAAAKEVYKKADSESQIAQKGVETAQKAVNEFLDRKRPEIKDSPRSLVDRSIQEALRNPNLFNEHANDLAALLKTPGPRASAALVARKQLLGFGLVKNIEGLVPELKTLRSGKAPLGERMTSYEKALLERFNAVILADVAYPGVISQSWQVNFVDARIAVPKTWRDVYQYSATGVSLGWTRYDGERASGFNADGLLILEKDGQGRCLKARTVKYQVDRAGTNARPLKQVPGDEVVNYAYDGEQDWKGHIKSREPAPPG
jgi:hypothetical protein